MKIAITEVVAKNSGKLGAIVGQKDVAELKIASGEVNLGLELAKRFSPGHQPRNLNIAAAMKIHGRSRGLDVRAEHSLNRIPAAKNSLDSAYIRVLNMQVRVHLAQVIIKDAFMQCSAGGKIH